MLTTSLILLHLSTTKKKIAIYTIVTGFIYFIILFVWSSTWKLQIILKMTISKILPLLWEKYKHSPLWIELLICPLFPVLVPRQVRWVPAPLTAVVKVADLKMEKKISVGLCHKEVECVHGIKNRHLSCYYQAPDVVIMRSGPWNCEKRSHIYEIRILEDESNMCCCGFVLVTKTRCISNIHEWAWSEASHVDLTATVEIGQYPPRQAAVLPEES